MKKIKSWHLALILAASAAFFPSANALDTVMADPSVLGKEITGFDDLWQGAYDTNY